MNKQKLITILILSILLVSCKNETTIENENHIQKLNLNGKIKFIKEVSFLALLKNGKVLKGEQQRELPVSSVIDLDFHDFLINFDKIGRITDYTFYYHDGEIYKKDTCQYISEKDIESDPAWKIQFLYKNKSESPVEYSSETKASYHYDNKGNLILIDYGDLEKTTYKYDQKGNIIEEKSFDENGELFVDESYEYKFDKMNNWIEKIKYINKEPEFVITRQIEYYK